MKAVKINNENFKIIEFRGAFVFYTDLKNKTICIQTTNANIVEVEESEIFTPKFSNSKTKKLNAANFMSKEEFAKSKYATMSKDDFEKERRRDAMNSKSW